MCLFKINTIFYKQCQKIIHKINIASDVQFHLSKEKLLFKIFLKDKIQSCFSSFFLEDILQGVFVIFNHVSNRPMIASPGSSKS